MIKCGAGGRDGISQMAAVVNIFVTVQTAHHTQAGSGPVLLILFWFVITIKFIDNLILPPPSQLMVQMYLWGGKTKDYIGDYLVILTNSGSTLANFIHLVSAQHWRSGRGGRRWWWCGALVVISHGMVLELSTFTALKPSVKLRCWERYLGCLWKVATHSDWNTLRPQSIWSLCTVNTKHLAPRSAVWTSL